MAPDGDAGPVTTSTLKNGLIARWRFDEVGGQVSANDVAGAPTGTLTDILFGEGKVGGAFSFNATTSRVTVPSSPSLALTTAFTLSVWVKLGASVPDDDQRFVRTPIDFKLNGRRPQIGVGSDSYAKSSYSLPEGEWHHITATFDAGVPRMFIDGVETTFDENTLTAKAVGPQKDPLYIGAFGDGYGVANGLLDDVRMWNRALTAAEAAELAKER